MERRRQRLLPSQRYQYKTLCSTSYDRARPTFRLLDLEPAENDSEDLVATFGQYDIHSSAAPSYYCPSYRWEGGDSGKFICVDGKWIEIWESLWNFLRALRREDEAVTVRADAICINQNDIHERSSRVALMGDIYRHAEEVHVWLGAADQGIRDTFAWAANPSELRHDESLPNVVKDAIIRLARRSY